MTPRPMLLGLTLFPTCLALAAETLPKLWSGQDYGDARQSLILHDNPTVVRGSCRGAGTVDQPETAAIPDVSVR